MSSEISIRDYKTNDKPLILDLLRLNTPQYFSPEEEKDLIFYLDNELESYFVAVYEDTIVGCGGINFSEDLKTGKISWDMVHPAFQGKGIGSRLLKYRITKLQSLDHIETISVRTSQHVYPFYEKLGFKLKEVKKDYWAPGFDLYSMEFMENRIA